MANKAHGTRQKLVFKVAAAKPRNPLALRARQRAAGAHQKSNSAKRFGAKLELNKLLDEK